MALHRGIQSAIFYYLSCAPCAEARYRKKRKQEAERGRADRLALEAEMPNLYRHPSPSSTNPHWGSEIAAGPVLSSRGRRKAAYAQNNDSQRRLKTATTHRSGGGSNVGSSIDLEPPEMTGRNAMRDGTLRVEDDAWAMMASTERLPSRSTTFSTSTFEGNGGVARPPRAVVRGTDLASSYSSFSNPTVNDLVPAISTPIASKEEALLLMQGPPTADYMSGRDGSTGRSRSDSGDSGRFSARSTGVPLSREVSRRMIERKLQNGELISRMDSSYAVNDPLGQRHDRASTDTKDFASSSGSLNGDMRRRVSPPHVQRSDDSAGSTGTVLHDPSLVHDPVQRSTARRVASRPQLSTIVSSDRVLTSENNPVYLNTLSPNEYGHHNLRTHSDTSLADRDRILRRPPIIDHEDTVRVLHGQKPPASVLNAQIVTSRITGKESHDRQASVDSITDASHGIFDTWYAPDFVLPEWVHEHTKREGVSKRWSMDI